MAKRKDLTSGRARRAIKIGGLASQVGSSYLWTRLSKPFLSAGEHERAMLDTHVRNAMRIVESSKELRGAFLKLIQMLSMRDDILPSQAIEVLKLTQSSVPPMDYEMISEQVKRELGKKPELLFARFDREAFAAASLGQVHRAELKSGQPVAVKVQYPGVEKTVEQDLKNLKMLLKAFSAIAHDIMRQNLDTADISKELEERLREELDYQREARNMLMFQRLLSDDPDIVIPRVIKDMSSRRVLTMDYVDGYRLADVLAPGVDRELKSWVAEKYFELVWRQIFEFGVLHTDPHPGNYLVTYHPRLAILDFGSIRRFSEEVRLNNLRLAQALLAGDRKKMARMLVALGYIEDGLDPAPMVEITQMLFEPAMFDRVYDPAEFDTMGKAQAIGEISIRNRIYKSPPSHSVFLLRALVGLEGIIKQLGIPLNYRLIFERCVAKASA